MVELRRKREKLELSPTLWVMTLELGVLGGWSPAGTLQIGWPTDYFTSGGQTVAEQDAASLADALDRSGAKALEEWQAGKSKPSKELRTPPSGFEWFNTSQGREHLRRLIAFFRGGAFEIH